MMTFALPTRVTVGGKEHGIRTDYRVILDICIALADPELSNEEKAVVCIGLFFINPEEIGTEHLQEALDECFRFINCGEAEHRKPGPKLVDWEKDFRWIASPINKMLGHDIRGVEMHWWTFLGYYYEIGDCTFAQIVKIRNAKKTGRKLDKADREWARKNAELVNIETKYTEAENALVEAWTGGGKKNAE